MMKEPVTLTFIFQTIGVILLVSTISFLLIKRKTKELKEKK